jgi:Holliday junction resolvase-like predicted endonuclease
LQSKAVSREIVAASTIDGALNEFFAHGRSVYELRRAQLREVAEEHNLVSWCNNLDKDFTWMANRYLEKYSDCSNVPVEDTILETQSGSCSENDGDEAEAIALRILKKCLKSFYFRTNVCSYIQEFGELDILCQHYFGNVEVIVAVEVKTSNSNNMRRKARKQIYSHCSAIQTLRPNAIIYGLCYYHASTQWSTIFRHNTHLPQVVYLEDCPFDL